MKRAERIVYAESFNTCSDAMKREKEIKRLTHREKSELINKKKKGNLLRI